MEDTSIGQHTPGSFSSKVDGPVPCAKCGIDNSQTRSRKWIVGENCCLWYHVTCVKLTRQIEAIGGDRIGPCCSAVSSTGLPGKVTINRNGPVLKRVPKASKIQAAKALTEVLEQVVIKNSLTAWQRLFDFARQCLSKPSRGRKKSKSLAAVVNKLIKDFTEHKLVEKNVSQNTSNNRKKSKHSSTEGQLISNMVSSKLGMGDVKGAVRFLSSDATVLDCTPEIVEKLKSKHPDLHKDSNFPAAPTESESLKSLTVSAEDAK